MGGGYHLIAEEASRLARLLPPSVVEVIAARLERDDDTGIPKVTACKPKG
jgi:hypothetical protein